MTLTKNETSNPSTTTTTTNTTNNNDAPRPEQDKLRRMLTDFDDGMLVSMSPEVGLRARPMRIIARDQEAPDDLWFISELDSAKVHELAREPRVAVVLGDHNRFVSISGRAQVIVDRDKLDAIGTGDWKLWVPEGTERGDLALIQVVPEHAEYWDHSSFKTVRLAFEVARARANDDHLRLPDNPQWHGAVSMS
ncbi:Pyridoxamine 5'-phosphate oxidase [Enhygromyxa salina]|uniref:Pyridoxamine 5'-phosphate oxidase n=1 Tax=Enhygromyxa salina TaxID=215803 RepID=A0A2S9XMI3_9BACT|nr:pyridoxamine 5'-phosphate oxidase family protein [Enhygromyxa salina]PRP94057.1 Pyridoxamine 5'-phosphate oxidase [Enhygromyxa salina]